MNRSGEQLPATDNLSSCSLYIAPSTVEGAGLGVFTAKELKQGDWVGVDADVCIPVLDLEWHNAQGSGDNVEVDYYFNPFSDYGWNGNSLGISSEVFELEDITAFWPGLDALVNSNPAVNNLERSLPENYIRYKHDHIEDYLTKRPSQRTPRAFTSIADPASGSFSPYIGGQAYVKRDIPAGGELFKDYGDLWFQERGVFATTPLTSDFDLVAKLLYAVSWKVPSIAQPRLYQLFVDIAKIWDVSPVLKALPNDWNAAEGILKDQNSRDPLLSVREGLSKWKEESSVRSLKWLQKHGHCADMIKPGPSTLKQVGGGQGAFARRPIQENQTIAVAPLLSIRNKTLLELYEIGPHPTDPHRYKRIQHIGNQLLMNYCYSHPTTTLALCPYTTGVSFINHNPEKANIRLEWADDGVLLHQASLLEQRIEDWPLSDDPQFRPPRLTMNFVAAKAISEGEELFLDYGEYWEHAWETHTKAWTSNVDLLQYLRGYQSAEDWNDRYGHDGILPTDVEQHTGQFVREIPHNLEIRCHSGLLTLKKHQFGKLKWEGSLTDGRQHPEYGVPCQIVERKLISISNSSHLDDPNRFEYDAILQSVDYLSNGEIKEIPRYNLPRHAFRWFDKAHTTPKHLAAAFRQYLGLPQDMVPDAWKNIEIRSMINSEVGEEL